MCLFTALFDVGLILPFEDCMQGWYAFIARICAEILQRLTARRPHHNLIQSGSQQLDIMDVRAAGDE